MNTMVANINDLVKKKCQVNMCQSKSHSFSVSDVEKAICRLKCGKHDGDIGHTSDHLKHGGHKLHSHISLLLNCMLSHGFVPSGLLISTLIPIPKNKKKSINSSDNYRAIALSSIIGKVLDNIILTNYSYALCSSDMQCGFKPKHSTVQCMFVLKEVVNYYQTNGSSVYVSLLDASKAFDRVNYIKLFEVLLSKGLCPLIARLLAYMYTNQSIRVKWNAYTSNHESVTNGVKQGGVLSPVLFAVYIDVLLGQLSKLGIGCHIGHKFTGAIAYADDIALLAPSLSALKYMINICQQFSERFDVLFNQSKSKLIVFGENVHELPRDLMPLERTSCDLHLGNLVGPSTDNDVMTTAISAFYRSVNMIISHFSHVCTQVKYKLFNSFCMSLYGSQLWNYSSGNIDRFYTAWRKSIRRLLCLPYRTHNCLINSICEDIPVDLKLHSRFLNFFDSILSSKNLLTRLCGVLALRGSNSSVSRSLMFLCGKYCVDKTSNSISLANIKSIFNPNILPDILQRISGAIIDLLYIRDNMSTNFTYEEITALLEYFCTKPPIDVF